VRANYREGNEALSKKDFALRMNICRKEAKESAYWLKLIIETNGENYNQDGRRLLDEPMELKKIFSSILARSE
jgi:four helix bundle protein